MAKTFLLILLTFLTHCLFLLEMKLNFQFLYKMLKHFSMKILYLINVFIDALRMNKNYYYYTSEKNDQIFSIAKNSIYHLVKHLLPSIFSTTMYSIINYVNLSN